MGEKYSVLNAMSAILFFVCLIKPVYHLWGESHLILSIAFGYYSSKNTRWRGKRRPKQP